jgi:hypothetical protein
MQGKKKRIKKKEIKKNLDKNQYCGGRLGWGQNGCPHLISSHATHKTRGHTLSTVFRGKDPTQPHGLII